MKFLLTEGNYTENFNPIEPGIGPGEKGFDEYEIKYLKSVTGTLTFVSSGGGSEYKKAWREFCEKIGKYAESLDLDAKGG